MGAIYRDAIKVLVWLGRVRASGIISSFATYGPGSRISSTSSLNEICTSMHDLDSYGQEGFEIHNDSSLDAFFQQAWFDRVWVVQEFVLARELEIYAGSCSFNYELFREAIRGVGTLVDMNLKATTVTLIQDLIRIREQCQVAVLGEGPLPTLYQCCYISRKCKCSIIHDKIYGVLGLAGNDLSIKVEYTYPATRLWLDLVLRSLEGGDLSPLHHAGISQGSGIDTHTTQSFIPPFEALEDKPISLTGKPAFCAGHGTAAKVEVIALGLVKLRGIEIDTVTYVTSRVKEPGISQTGHDIYQIFSQPEELIRIAASSPYITEDFVQVFTRTLTAGAVGLAYKHEDKDSVFEWGTSFILYTSYRVIFLTRKGYIGLGPYGMQEGDKVVIFDGDSTPFVLRADESEYDRWKLVGECYLDGWMYGDLFGHTVVEGEGEGEETNSQDVQKYAEEEVGNEIGEAKSEITLQTDNGEDRGFFSFFKKLTASWRWGGETGSGAGEGKSEGKVLKRTSFILC